MTLWEKFNESGRYLSPRNLALVGTLALGISATGCQAIQRSYNDNPANRNFIVREMGQTSNCMDVVLPRTYYDTGDRALKSLGKIPFDLAEVVDSVTGVVGFRPFRGRFWTIDAWEPGIFDEINLDSIRYIPLDRFEGKGAQYVKYGVWHPVGSTLEILSSVGRTFGDGFNVASQVVNAGAILPLTANDSEMTKVFAYTPAFENSSVNDSVKRVVDGVTDPVKGPVKYVLTCANTSDVVPYTLRLFNQDAKQWAGVSLGDKEKAYLQRAFFLNLDCSVFSYDYKRMFVDVLPLKSLDRAIWGTQLRMARELTKEEDGKGFEPYYLTRIGKGREIRIGNFAHTLPLGVPTNIGSDILWYNYPVMNDKGDKVVGYKKIEDPAEAPGVINNGKYYPAQSNLVAIGRDIFGLFSFFVKGWGGEGSGGQIGTSGTGLGGGQGGAGAGGK